MSVKSVLLGAAVALAAFASSAQAAVITFETAPIGPYAGFGTYTEDGFTYSVETGGLFVNQWGNPGHDMEGSVSEQGGILRIVAEDNSLFTFTGLDFAAFGPEGEAQFAWVTGWLEGVEVGFEFFLLDNVQTFSPSYANWTTFAANNLANRNIDALSIALNAGTTNQPPGTFIQAIDNVTFGPTAIPEPATWALMITGFGLAGVMLRRRRVAVAA